MTDENEFGKSPTAARLVHASQYRNGALLGKFQIQASTKHGTTTLVSVAPAILLEPGDTLVTEGWMFSFRNFVVVGKHVKPMKIAGDWYEVQGTKAPAKK